MRINTEDGTHNLCTAGAHQSRYAQDFALAQLKADITEDARLVEAFHLKDNLLWLIASVRIELGNRASDHVADNLLHAVLLHRLGRYGYTVTHNGNSVAVGGNLLHTVRDIHHRHATLLQRTHNLEQLLRLTLGERCCRLVHDNHLGIDKQVTHNFCHLLLADGAFARLHVQRQLNFNLAAFFLCQLTHSFKIQYTHTIGNAVHHKQVFQDTQIRPDIQLLMNEGNAMSLSLQRILEAHLLAVNKNLSLILLMDACQDIHERGFTSTILTHERMHLAAFQRQVYALQHLVRTKGFMDIF